MQSEKNWDGGEADSKSFQPGLGSCGNRVRRFQRFFVQSFKLRQPLDKITKNKGRKLSYEKLNEDIYKSYESYEKIYNPLDLSFLEENLQVLSFHPKEW